MAGATVESFVHEGELELPAGADPAAVGAAVTTALCGHWEHERPCRWPHNNAIQQKGATFLFRTLFVAPASEETQVRAHIEGALRDGGAWRLLGSGSRNVAPREEELAGKLTA